MLFAIFCSLLLFEVSSAVPWLFNGTIRQSYKNSGFYFDDYMRYEDIVTGIEYYESEYKHVEKIALDGETFLGEKIVGARIALAKKSLPVVFVECGIHGREWRPPAVCSYIIQQLSENMLKYQDLLDRYEFQIFPSVNPDGYTYTQSSDGDRLHRGNMKTVDDYCLGVDLNRNFDVGGFYDADPGYAAYLPPCQQDYPGKSPFSEPETQAIRNTVLAIKDRIQFYIAIHSYAQAVMFPYFYKLARPANYQNLNSKAKAAVEAIFKFSQGKTKYLSGTMAEILTQLGFGPGAGSSVDWAYEKAGIQNAFAIELPPHFDGNAENFQPPPETIKSVVQETLVGIRALLLAK